MGNFFCTKQTPEGVHQYCPEERAKEMRDMVKDLEAKGQRPIVTRGGISFIVDYKEGDRSRMPPREDDRRDKKVYDMIVNNDYFPELLNAMHQYMHADDEEDDDEEVEEEQEEDEGGEEEIMRCAWGG